MSGSNLFRGTLDLLILQTLKWDPLHGYGIGRWIKEATEGRLELEEGVLYPALRRLENRGWIRGEWGENDTGRKARFYSLTREGWEALQKETARWEDHAGAVYSILRRWEG
jgi:transcriptional regulator